MKQFIITLMLIMVGCEEAHVLQNDGNRELAVCGGVNWTECISGACPAGFVIVGNKNNSIILKCK